MNPVEFSILLLCLVSGHETFTLNRMLDYWQPNDVYVILNSTNTSEDVIATMTYPRFVSVQGDFWNFIRKKPIRSTFPDNFVLVLFTEDSCRSAIPILRDQMSQLIIVKRSKVVIVTRTVQRTKIEALFRNLWQMGLLNVFVLDDTFIWGYNPFADEFLIQRHSADYHNLISVDRAGNLFGAQLNIPLIELYPAAQNITWHNRSIQVGNNIEVQRPLAEFFNATLRVYHPEVVDFGFEFFTNATSSVIHPGIGKELALGRADLTLNNRVYSSSNYFDFLMPLYFRECNLMIPKSGRIPQYTIVASVAFSWVGLFTIATLMVAIVFAVIMKRTLRTKLDVMRFGLELGSVFIGQNFRFPIETVSIRFIIICWLMVCICLQPIFNAEIVTSFLTPMFVGDLDQPFDAIRSEQFRAVYTFDDFTYYLRGNSKELFASEEIFQLLLKKLHGVPREEFFERVMHPNKRDMFLMISMADNLLEKTKYLTEQTYSYHKTRPVFISLIGNIVPRGSIIYNHYNDFSYRIFEAGLLQHWKILELLYEIKFGSSNEAQKKSLTTEDLYSAFLVLVLGYAMAATVFGMEMLRVKFVKSVRM